MDRECSVSGCDRRSRTRGWCSAHYMRWRKLGDPTAGGPMLRTKPKKICEIDDCPREVIGRGWCSVHYDHWYRWGHPLASAPEKTPDVDRFWAKVDKTDGCWLWMGHKNAYGYPRFSHQGRESFAHRYSYEMHFGEIPEGCDIDHRCHTPLCVRPDHLRAVTHKQNLEHRKGATAASSTGYLGVFRAPMAGMRLTSSILEIATRPATSLRPKRPTKRLWRYETSCSPTTTGTGYE